MASSGTTGERVLAIGSLTDSPTSLFWLTFGILLLTVALIVIGIITWRSAISRKKVLLTITSRSQIFSAPESMRDDLQIRFRNDPVQGDLYVTAIELANTGRLAIRSDDFDSARSLQFALDTKIIKHLSTEHAPKSAPAPSITITDDTFSLAPELITTGEIIKFALLTDGRPSRVETAFSPFGEVRIVIGDREQLALLRSRMVRRAVVGIGTLLLIILIVSIYSLALIFTGSINLSKSSVAALGCSSLPHDLITASESLQAVQSQIPVRLEDPATGQAGIFESYYALLFETQDEMDHLTRDYSNIASVGDSTYTRSSMPSEINKADSIISTILKENINVSDKIDLAKQLMPIRGALSSSSAVPTICEKKQN